MSGIPNGSLLSEQQKAMLAEQGRMNDRVGAYNSFERGVSRRVYELSQGWHPAHNVAPLMELVRMAHSMGYEVVTMGTGRHAASANTQPSGAATPDLGR